MFRYFPLLLLACALAFVSLRGPAPANAVAVPDYVTTGGWFTEPPFILNDSNGKVNFGGVLQCDAPFDMPNQLIIHYGDHAEFKLDGITSANCTLNDPNDPNSGGQFLGSGVGLCNGAPANAFTIQLIDGGQGNAPDLARFAVSGVPGCVFAQSSPNPVEGGQITLHAQ